MASFLCPRTIASPTSLTNSLKLPTRPLLRCLHTSTPTARHHRRLPNPSCTPSTSHTPLKSFSHSATRRAYKTVEEARAKTHSGPFSLRSAILFLTAGGCMIVYFRWEKDRIERKKIADAAKGVGKPKVGGKFELVDQMGRVWTEASLKGGFTLVRVSFSLLYLWLLRTQKTFRATVGDGFSSRGKRG
ncbi:MAG: hypothetical protein LQ346_002950 [Caloplaca aetnensis]|nr:MAG: hypothetical protein LQ346_002950 [Caloplaca aetnensis]